MTPPPDAARKEFPTAEVLSAITGHLVCEIGGVYRVLNWMTGENLFTHQLPDWLRVESEIRRTAKATRRPIRTGLGARLSRERIAVVADY
jgi:hypothetical protein